MSKQWQSKNVTVVRVARQGDDGYDANKSPQDLIRLEDGSEKVVSRSEVTDKPL